MFTIQNVCDFLEEFAPSHLAEDWDNVGLLVGDKTHVVKKIMTCLTITAVTADEAVRERADLIVTHHPLPFKPIKRLTSDSTPGRLLLQLISGQIAIHSPHTAFDSAAMGINQLWAERLGLQDIRPLIPAQIVPASLSDSFETSPLATPRLGSGRCGTLSENSTMADLVLQIRNFLGIKHIQCVGERSKPIRKIGIACGSAGSFLEPACRSGCDLLITGETSFHTCLEAEARGIALILTGHYSSERFGVEQLANQLQRRFSSIAVWASNAESDPLYFA